MGPTKYVLAAALFGALAHTGAAAANVHEGSLAAQISFGVPEDWVVQNEQELLTSGFIVPPEPLFALVASPSPGPSSFVLEASSAPWLFVTVEDPTSMLAPSQAYELMPQYLVQTEPGYSNAKVETLVAHRSVHQGGLSASGVTFGEYPTAVVAQCQTRVPVVMCGTLRHPLRAHLAPAQRIRD